MKPALLIAPLLAAAISAPVSAESKWAIHPVQNAGEVIRYVQGVPTVELEMNDGVVRVTPLPMEHGSLVFTVAAYNDGSLPANFGIENVAPSFAGKPVKVFSKDELVRRAKNRAFWSQFGLAVLGATASGLAASQRDYYSSSLVTPRGTYTSLFSAPSIAGQYQAASITAGTAFSIYLVERQLDRTIIALGDQTVQLTTVDPGESYAGRIVLDKIRPRDLPQRITITVNWNGETYPFTFELAKRGTPAPAFKMVPRRSDLTDFSQRFAMTQTPPPAPVPVAQTRTPAAIQPRSAPTDSDSRFGNRRIRCTTCQ